MQQLDLLDYTPQAPAPKYPHAPGHRHVDTSMAAADTISTRCGMLRLQIMNCLATRGTHGGTPDEIAEILSEDILNVRPRFTELKQMGKIFDSGNRRINAKGNTQRVWRAI